ncbi:hypothetical protein PSP6_280047 [Paraburkholderia tropica]|nr:hypothetical protein PSP6_280047 [Paraburkholderia tropica]
MTEVTPSDCSLGASFIEDAEIPQQQRDNTFVAVGVANRH